MSTRFSLGQVVITRSAAEVIPPNEAQAALARHAAGDWGEVGDADRRENELSLREGFRLLSVYCTCDGTSFWIITEADRSNTTILLPGDY